MGRVKMKFLGVVARSVLELVKNRFLDTFKSMVLSILYIPKTYLLTLHV